VPASAIVVCLRPVVQTHLPLRLIEGGMGLRPADALLAPNPADLTALAVALRLRAEAGGNLRVVALTVGPAAWEEPLRLALGAGADEALRVARPGGEAPPPDGSAATTAAAAAAAAGVIGTLNAALVLTGDRSADLGHGCFAALLAHALGLPLALRAQALRGEGGGWVARAKLEAGYTQELRLAAPAVVALAPGPEAPPPASLPRWLAARAATIRVVPMPGPSAPGASTRLRAPVPRVRPYRVPDPDLPPDERIGALLAAPEGRAGRVLDADTDPAVQAAEAARLLAARGFV